MGLERGRSRSTGKPSQQFGFEPPLRDIVWRALNARTGEVGSKEDYRRVEFVKAFMRAIEGKDIQNLYSQPMEIFLFEDELAELRKLRAAGELDVVERIALATELTPASLDELRKTLSAKARITSNDENWIEVVEFLEWYDVIADRHAARCIELVNQKPPGHTNRDLKLLERAKEKLRIGG